MQIGILVQGFPATDDGQTLTKSFVVTFTPAPPGMQVGQLAGAVAMGSNRAQIQAAAIRAIEGTYPGITVPANAEFEFVGV
jgi:hypothetical protein